MSDENINDASPSLPAGDNDAQSEESFAELFEKNGQLPERLKPGEKVTARVVSISGDLVYVDLGGKSEGAIELKEFTDEDGNIQIQEGDEVNSFFVRVQDGLMRMTTLLHGYSMASLNALKEAHQSGTPIDGIVEKEVKGGFEVRSNGVRCFCPASQLDLRSVRNSKEYIGNTFPFRVLEFGEEGRNIVVSRRVILEEERREKVEKLKETLEVDTEVSVPVTSVRKFGVFVDIGGIDALIPISEMSWARLESPDEIVSVGDTVKAKVITINWENERITLSIKALQPDPWIEASKKYPEGSKVQGTIVRLVPFGAFVAVEAGLDGLMHISNLGTGRRIKHPKEVVKVGQPIEAYVLSVDAKNRKLSLSMQPKPEPKKVTYPKAGDVIEGTVENVMPYGLFVKISDDLTGLIPNSEMATSKGSDHSKMFPAGTKMKVVVLDVDTKNNKVGLSRKAVEEKEARADYEQFKESVKKEKENSGGIGSLGELLKAKMEEKNISQ
jgi:small subunit ribosomal protein S1